MILGFKTKINGKATFFPQKILACVSYIHKSIGYKPKKHTLRKGNRWEAGMSIQMAVGVRTPRYFQFNKSIEGLQKCISVQEIVIKYPTHEFTYPKDIPKIYIDGWVYDYRDDEDKKQLIQLAINDGFDSFEEFLNWFSEDFSGQIIHWTDLVYRKSI